jgi:hypothetical protein
LFDFNFFSSTQACLPMIGLNLFKCGKSNVQTCQFRPYIGPPPESLIRLKEFLWDFLVLSESGQTRILKMLLHQNRSHNWKHISSSILIVRFIIYRLLTYITAKSRLKIRKLMMMKRVSTKSDFHTDLLLMCLCMVMFLSVDLT